MNWWVGGWDFVPNLRQILADAGVGSHMESFHFVVTTLEFLPVRPPPGGTAPTSQGGTAPTF
jgi:hypothetical protein